MQHEPGNARTVFVTQADYTKDLSDARRYGELRAVFANVRKPYDTPELLRKARKVLAAYQPGDYLLLLGDPALSAVCLAVICEREGAVNLLSWDRNSFSYVPQNWNFDKFPEEPQTADDDCL
jgi:hypothetical protein